MCVCRSVCIGALERLNCVVLTSNTCNKHVQTNDVCLSVHICVCERERVREGERGGVGRVSLARLCQCRVDRFNHPTKNPLPVTHTRIHVQIHTHKHTYIKPLFYFIKTHIQTFTQAAKHIRTHPLCRQRPPKEPTSLLACISSRPSLFPALCLSTLPDCQPPCQPPCLPGSHCHLS